MADVTFERLPKICIPKHYHLVLTPNIEALTFEAEVSIDLQVNTVTDRITLNAIELSFKTVILKIDDTIKHTPLQTKEDVKNETVEFVFSESILPGKYVLHIEYMGEINDKMKGLFRSKYINQQGKSTYSAITQFAPTDARRCFPCWDEPTIKSTFDISLIVPINLVALSNMPIKKSTNENGLKRYDFETTPIMSTYLVALVVGEYDFVEDHSSDGVLVRVYTPSGKKEQGLFALEVAKKVLPYYKEYFKIAYPLPKMDLIAIADCGFGAMENWGLITYREACLLLDSKNSSALQKQHIALIIGHEIAHQWFGNLVTMEWWTHLWLNEGYASFVEFLCVNHLFPEYDIWTQFVNSMYIKALELDSLKNSHPIEVPIKHPSDLDEIFDEISYNKGASIIRMLHNYIGNNNFQNGMHLYLTRFQYKNAETEDLWNALDEASGKPVKDVMSTWTKQMGFPLVKVSRTLTRDGTGVTLSLTQSKFCGDSIVPTERYLWMIPISISSKNSNEIIDVVLSRDKTDVVVPNVGNEDWIKINTGSIGFYRTLYPCDMMDQFLPSIKDKSLPPADRLGLINDLFALVRAGYARSDELLRLLQAYDNETDYNVWSCVVTILTKISMLLDYTEFKDAFKNFEKKLLNKISKALGWDPYDNENHVVTLLRGIVLSRLAWLDDDKTIEEARRRFADHIGSGPSLPADLRSGCYKTVLRAGDRNTFDSLMNLYRTTDLREEKDRISYAFGASKDETLLSEVLKFSFSDEVRDQDAVYVMISVSATPIGRTLTWQFFKENWKAFVERFHGGFLLTRFVKYVAEHFASEEMANEIESFFKKNNCSGLERTVQQGVEAIRLNSAWLVRDNEAIKLFLKDF